MQAMCLGGPSALLAGGLRNLEILGIDAFDGLNLV
jgi:hypothetical protein